MSSIKIAIVGRPNVGKSALFNRICKKRLSIVAEEEGVTRDRLYAKSEFFGTPFEIIDTGGIDPKSKALFNELIGDQAKIAVKQADVLIMVVDSQIGPTAIDKQVARYFLTQKKPIILAINKIDHESHEEKKHLFYSLGIKEMICVSATQGFQVAELMEKALSFSSLEKQEDMELPKIRLSIVGKPNVGKSTLFNYLLKDKRSVVSPIAGTTRDHIIESLGDKYLLIDTAGIRKKNKERDVIEKFSAVRTNNAIEETNICLFLLDSVEGITVQEKKITSMIEEKGKSCILLFNKWDLIKGVRMEHALKEMRDSASFLKHCPFLFISAKEGRNIDKIFDLILEVQKERDKRISTANLNTFLEKTMQKCHPPRIRGKRLRIYYMTQVSNNPPRFVLFVNYKDLITETYKKYLINQMRLEFSFTGNPLIFQIREKKPSPTREKKQPNTREKSFK